MADIVPVQRTSHGLIDALFNVIDQLNARQIDAEHARAISHTAKTIVNVAALELEYRKFASDGGDAKLISLTIDGK